MKKIKVFVEYKIIPEKRMNYLKLANQLSIYYRSFHIDNFSIYEGIDQPNLFVEDFIVSNYESFIKLKSERIQEQRPFWSDLHSCVFGDVNNVNIYAFEEL